MRFRKYEERDYDGEYRTKRLVLEAYDRMSAAIANGGKAGRARLLWSDDWSTFLKQPDFWVTVVGIGFRDQSSAQAWCTDHKLDRDHCFPTLIRR